MECSFKLSTGADITIIIEDNYDIDIWNVDNDDTFTIENNKIDIHEMKHKLDCSYNEALALASVISSMLSLKHMIELQNKTISI